MCQRLGPCSTGAISASLFHPASAVVLRARRVHPWGYDLVSWMRLGFFRSVPGAQSQSRARSTRVRSLLSRTGLSARLALARSMPCPLGPAGESPYPHGWQWVAPALGELPDSAAEDVRFCEDLYLSPFSVRFPLFCGLLSTRSLPVRTTFRHALYTLAVLADAIPLTSR